VIQVEGVSKIFQDNKREYKVLSDITFTIETNEFVCILGPSGCGKTVLLDILGGFSKPTFGQVLIDGQVIGGPSPNRITIFQDYKLLPWRSVRKNIELGLESKKLTKSQIDDIVDEQIELTGLTGFENYRPAEISGGMKQRVAIARALAMEPDVLFMDEPFGALDTGTKEAMQLNLKHMLHSGRTVVFVTHDVDEAVFLADRILIMRAAPGKISSIIQVDLPKPTFKYTRDFNAMRDRVMDEMALVSNK
jgi:NitT/TauT family transport system ATP-binding protein